MVEDGAAVRGGNENQDPSLVEAVKMRRVEVEDRTLAEKQRIDSSSRDDSHNPLPSLDFALANSPPRSPPRIERSACTPDAIKAQA